MGGTPGTSDETYSQNIPTVFIDNLPHEIRKTWVYNLFSRYGKIRDIFIPNKKSKITGQSFGFVRFYRRDEAARAVSETNHLWYWGHRLVVKFARFLRKEDNHGFQGSVLESHISKSAVKNKIPQISSNKGFKKFQKEKRGKEVWRRKGVVESSKQGKERNAKVVGESKPLNTKTARIQTQPIGNGWLCRSALAKISRLVSTMDLEYIFRREKVHNVQIKNVGGRFVIVIFPDAETRDSTIKKRWISNWFEDINPWNGEQAKDERFVWLSCFGMPLHAWSESTFKEIGSNWGHFLQVDDDTLKEKSYAQGRILIATEQPQRVEGHIELVVEGKIFIVRVEEEDSFRTINESQFPIPINSPLEEESEGKNDEDHDMDRKKDEVEEFADLETTNGEKAIQNGTNVASPVENSTSNSQLNYVAGIQAYNGPVIDASSSISGTGTSAVGDEKVLDSFGGKNALNEDFLKNDEHESNHDDVNNMDPQLDLFEDNRNPIQAVVKGSKGKKKRKNINEILGLTSVKGGKNKSKCVVFRSVVAAAALSASVSTDGMNNRNRILLNEAQTIWEFNKIMGLGYDGDEEEVISKIAELEAQRQRPD